MKSRTEILEPLREKISAGGMLRVGRAMMDLPASIVVAEKCDLLFLHHTCRFQNASALTGLFPFEDANGAILDLEKILFPLLQKFSVVAGVCGTDPFRLPGQFLDEIKSAGFAGVQNFPTLGMMDGNFRARLEESRIGYAKEVEMIRFAHERDLLTVPFIFNSEQAEQMVKAGADILVVHPGAKAFRKNMNLPDFEKAAAKIAEQARKMRKDLLVVRHRSEDELVKI